MWAEGEHDVLSTYSRDLGVLLEFQQVRKGSASGVSGTSGFLSNGRMRIGPHLETIWGTQSSLGLQEWHQVSSRLLTVFLGIFWSSLRKSSLLSCFMWNTELLWRQCRGIGPHLTVSGKISWFFSSCGGNLGFPLDLQWGCSLNTRVFSVTSGLLSSFHGHFVILLESWQVIRDTSRVEEGEPGSLTICPWDIGIPIYFQEESGIISRWSMQLHILLEMSKACKSVQGHVSSCEDVGEYAVAFEGMWGRESVWRLVRACDVVQECVSSCKDMQGCSKLSQNMQWCASSWEEMPGHGWVCYNVRECARTCKSLAGK